MLPELIQALDHIKELMVFYEPDFRVLWVNQATVRWAGKSRNEILGRRCFEAFYGRTAPCPGCLIRKVFRTGEPVESEHQGGDGRTWAVRAYPVRSETGVLRGAMEISLDLSAVKEVQAALKDRESRYHAVLQNTLDGICVVSTESWTIEEINPALTAMLGYRDASPVGASFVDFLASDKSCVERQLWDVLRTKKGRVLETSFATRDGERLEVELTLNPLALQGEDRIIVVCRDVRERNVALADRLRAQKLASLAVMAEGMAHDFNNILAGVVGNLSLAKIDADPQSRLYSRLRAAEKACARAEEITRQLLAFADGGEPTRRSVPAREWLSEKVLPGLETLAVEVSSEFSEDLPSIRVDAELLTRALVDLAAGILVRKGAAAIHVEGRRETGEAWGGNGGTSPGPWVRITLSASDVHLTPHELDRVFDPYSIKNFAVGKGLGICAAYAAVRRHGGHIEARCERRAGTRLIVLLPSDGDFLSAAPGENSAPEISSLHKGRLLIMDDECIVRETLGEILRLKGYEVTVAADGPETVTHYKEGLENGRPFHAVILDLTVRGGPGAVEILKELRRMDPNVRAFVTSGFTFDPVMIDPQRYGFCGAAQKPFQYDELARHIQRFIGTGTKSRP